MTAGPQVDRVEDLTDPVDGRTTVVLVRHAQTTWGAQGRYVGRRDIPLSELGLAQLEPLADRLAGLQPTAVLTSPLSRCRMTAEAIGASHGLTPVAQDGLLDGALGEWSGHHPEEIERRWPVEFAAWRSDPGAAPPGGESFTDIRTRMTATVLGLLEQYRGGTLVVVSHAAPSKMVCAWALGAGSEVAYRIRIDNASVTVIDVDPNDRAVVVTVNDTAHLATPHQDLPRRP